MIAIATATRTIPMTRIQTTRTPSTKPVRSAKGEAVRASRSMAADCRCGQQLDYCARAHCPRCGRSITRP